MFWKRFKARRLARRVCSSGFSRWLPPEGGTTSGRTRQPSLARLGLEALEDRTLLAIVTWDGGAVPPNFNWNDPANWSGDTLPGTGDDVTIPDLVGTPVITSSGAVAIRSLTSAERIAITGGSLSVLQPAQLAAGLDQTGGVFFSGTPLVSSSTVSVGSGSTLAVSGMPASGLVSLWHAEGTALDAADGNHGTLVGGATFAGGKIGQAFSFDGLGDYVAAADSPAWDLAGDFAISLRVRFDQIKDTMFIHQQSGTVAGGFEFDYQTLSGGQLVFALDPTTVGISRPWQPAADQWYHLAVTRTGAMYRLYVDGLQLGADATGGAPANVTGQVRIGSWSGMSGTDTSFDIAGRIDELAIHNRALSAAEIQASMAGGTYIITSAGSLNGTGLVSGNVTNAGVLAPGNSPGPLSISGNYSQQAIGEVNIEIAGTTPGTQYDELVINGTVTLAGTLNVSLLGGFTPAVGNSFTIIDNDGADAVSGTFSGLAQGDSSTSDPIVLRSVTPAARATTSS